MVLVIYEHPHYDQSPPILIITDAFCIIYSIMQLLLCKRVKKLILCKRVNHSFTKDLFNRTVSNRFTPRFSPLTITAMWHVGSLSSRPATPDPPVLTARVGPKHKERPHLLCLLI